jgi:Zn-finger nucleic acid-binding protein
MEPVEFEGIEVDRCTLCKGLWFDLLEHERLRELPGSEVIDCGDPDVGALFNRDDRISCPRCSGSMIRMVDSLQPHIWYESCGVCHGVFLDAGEFTDYKHHTPADLLRALRSGERR